MKEDADRGESTITRSCQTTAMSAGRKYVQLLFGFGFGGGKDRPIHEQSMLVGILDVDVVPRGDSRHRKAAFGVGIRVAMWQ